MSVHLFTRSSYSLLDSTIRIQELVSYAKRSGFSYAALTDHNVLYAVPQFLKACGKENIKPIVGMETDILYHDKKVPFLLLAKDNIGYAELMQLSSKLNGLDHPLCTLEDLQKALHHCICIVYGEGGYFDGELIHEQYDEVCAKLMELKQDLHEFDVAISYNEASLWKMRNKNLKGICTSLRIRTVALNKIYYLRKEDAGTYRLLRGIREGKKINDASLTQITGRYYLSIDEMRDLYDADDVARTDELAAMCRADFKLPETNLPSFPLKEGITSDVYLRKLCEAGLNKRLNGRVSEAYQKRLQYELSVIIGMHYEDYFLIVYDFIRYARKNGIYVGPGRGSAAGSLVSYCLGITMIDPMRYHLLFERFLNPERISLPDIDTDIPDDKRDEVIQYVYEKYGAEHVSNIVTFGTLGTKQVLRDVGKMYGVLQRDLDTLLRMIPQGYKGTLQQLYQSTPRFRQYIGSKDILVSLYQNASQLEGLPRHVSVHAAGIVLSKDPIGSVVPTISLREGMHTIQFTHEYLQDKGLIKIDFLGLRNLSIIQMISAMIQKDDPSFDILHIPLNEKSAYEVFARGDTMGIFQFESAGMKRLLQDIKPHNLEDVAIAMALYRPGAMAEIPHYLDVRANPEKVTYTSRSLEPILKETCGIMIYQEQVMLISQSAAGFSLAKADILRKAISKKNAAEMEKLKNDFILGCVRNGYTEENAVHLFSLIEKFAGYGFNKSHAIAYSFIAYQLAYLKAKYPLQFYICMLNDAIGDQNKTARYIDECRRRRIQIAGINIQFSKDKYTLINQKLVLPFSLVKGVGTASAKSLYEEREKNGLYEDFFSFVARALLIKLKEDDIRNLISAGALDCLKETRETMLRALDDAVRYGELVRIRKDDSFVLDLSLISKPNIIRIAENKAESIEREREVLGFQLGPSYLSILRKEYGIHLPSIASMEHANGSVKGFAEIRSVKEHRTKKGDMMAFIQLSDETGSLDMAVMPREYQKYAAVLHKGIYCVFEGRSGRGESVICDRMQVVKKGRDTNVKNPNR